MACTSGTILSLESSCHYMPSTNNYKVKKNDVKWLVDTQISDTLDFCNFCENW